MKATVAPSSEVDALTPPPSTQYASDWYWQVPPGTLVYVNALAGEVFCPLLIPSRQWLADWELDAWAATVQ